MKPPPVHALHWRRAWRLVPTRIPRINLYERIAPPKEQGRLIQLEQMTNPRILMEKGEVSRLRKQDHFLPHASLYVKAPFANLAESRFGNGTFSILYAAANEQTALAEKTYHDVQFWRAHRIPVMAVKRRALFLNVGGRFHDLRGRKSQYPGVYSAESYSASQALGLTLWQEGSAGIAYDSVRRPKGECLAVFSPQTIRECRLGPVYEFHWDGETITDAFRLSRLPGS